MAIVREPEEPRGSASQTSSCRRVAWPVPGRQSETGVSRPASRGRLRIEHLMPPGRQGSCAATLERGLAISGRRWSIGGFLPSWS
jgi:hypothetical protein